MRRKRRTSKKKKWDSFASNSVTSLSRQRRENIGIKKNTPWQKGLPHYGSN